MTKQLPLQCCLWAVLYLAVLGTGCSPASLPAVRSAGRQLPTSTTPLPALSERDHAPTVAVLLIAVQSPQSILPDAADDLKFVLDDARQLREDFQSICIPAENIVLLEDEQATAASVSQQLLTMSGQLMPHDTLFIVFIGHGVMGQGSEFVLYDRNLPVRNLLDQLASSPAARAVLIADACHSGRPGSPQFVLRDDQVTREGGLAWIVSARGDQHAFEDPDLGHGVFSCYLSEILQNYQDYDRNHDDAVSVEEIAEPLRQKVGAWCRKRHRPNAQEPDWRLVNWGSAPQGVLPIRREWKLSVLNANQEAKIEVQFPMSQLAEDDCVCVIVAPELTRGRYYPQPVMLRREDGPVWTGTIYLGSGPRDIGKKFLVGVVLADPDLRSRLMLVGSDYGTDNPPLSELPLKTQVTVTRLR